MPISVPSTRCTGIVSPKSRATTIGFLLIVSLIGNGIGPLFTGMMSDFFMNAEIAAAGLTDIAANFNPRLCARSDAIGVNGPELCGAYAGLGFATPWQRRRVS